MISFQFTELKFVYFLFFLNNIKDVLETPSSNKNLKRYVSFIVKETLKYIKDTYRII